jgi:hypothetical protein
MPNHVIRNAAGHVCHRCTANASSTTIISGAQWMAYLRGETPSPISPSATNVSRQTAQQRQQAAAAPPRSEQTTVIRTADTLPPDGYQIALAARARREAAEASQRTSASPVLKAWPTPKVNTLNPRNPADIDGYAIALKARAQREGR